MREVDRLMVEFYGISLVQMMENAGRNLAELALQMMSEKRKEKSVLILCGQGNNGGGGMVAARHLHNWGVKTHVILAAETSRLKEVPEHQWAILKAMELDITGEPPQSPDLVLDALLGYGVSGDPRPKVANWINWANNQSAPVLSLDVPSGLDATSGLAHNPTIHASATMTLALPKTGLLESCAREFVGDLFLADIGVPNEVYRKAFGISVPTIFSAKPVKKYKSK